MIYIFTPSILVCNRYVEVWLNYVIQIKRNHNNVLTIYISETKVVLTYTY